MNNLSKAEKSAIYTSVLDENRTLVAKDLLGLPVKNVKVKISEKDRKDLFKQHLTSPLCHCAGCIELAKIFIDNSRDLKEQIIGVSMIEAEAKIKG